MDTDKTHRERFRRNFRGRYALRVHMFFLLSLTMATGTIVNRTLVHILPWMGLRYPLAVLASYGVFLLLLEVWVSLFANDPQMGDMIQAELPPTSKRKATRGSGSSGSSGNSISWFDVSDIGGDEGCLVIFAFLFAVLAIFGGVYYLVYYATDILADAAFQVVLGGSLVKSSIRVSSSSRQGSIVKATFLPFFLSALAASIWGFTLAFECPGAHVFHEAWVSCRP